MESAMHSAMAVWRQAAEAYVDFLKAPMFTVGGLPVPGVILLLIVMLCGNVLYQFLRKGETSKVDDSKTVEARQIVTKTEKDALAAKKRVKAGEEFRKVAKEVSTSPEGQLGGVLGTMKPGMKPVSKTVQSGAKSVSLLGPECPSLHILWLADFSAL